MKSQYYLNRLNLEFRIKMQRRRKESQPVHAPISVVHQSWQFSERNAYKTEPE